MKKESSYLDLPYRSGVGMMLINHNKQILLGKRSNTKFNSWQMPQGGIEIGETPSMAAIREIKEELGTSNIRIIKESKKWYSYDIPKPIIHKLWGGAYKGQRQKWFLLQFIGEDKDINISTTHQEFIDWKWANLEDINQEVIYFKKKLYNEIIKEFLDFIK